MRKRELVKKTVVMTAMLLASAVGYTFLDSGGHLPLDSGIAVVNFSEADALEEAEVQEPVQTPPEIVQYNKSITLEAGKKLALKNFGIKVKDDSTNLKYVFNNKTYKKVGTYTVAVKVIDKETNLFTTVNIKVKVRDTTAPKIYGAKNVTVKQGTKINLLKGVTAKDNISGNLTKKIKVSKYNTKLYDKTQTVTLSVKDASGNVTKKKIKLKIKSDPIKKLNKTMYATTSLNVRSSSSSKGKKIGVLSYAQKVTVTGQDKNTGWYRIKYNGKVGYVSNAYLSSKKPVVKKPTTSSSTSNKTSSSSSSNKTSSSSSSNKTSSSSSSNKTSSSSSNKTSSSSSSNKNSSSSSSTKKPSSSSSSSKKPSSSSSSNKGSSSSDKIPEYIDCDWSNGSWTDGKVNNNEGSGW